MAIAFSSTIHTIVPGLRVAGEQIASLEVRDGDSDTLYAGVKTALLIVNGDNDINLAESTTGPFTYSPDIDALYSQFSAAGMYEVVPGKLLINPSSFSVIRISGSEVVIDIEGSEAPFVFKKNATATEVIPGPGSSWELPAVTFDAFAIAATTFRESVDLELEDLGDSLAQEIVDRMAADTAEAARVDALIASGMWLYADQAAFPPAADNHGRVVHSHADGAMFYAHGGMWHKIENEAEAEAARAAIQADVDQNESDADAAIAAEAAARAAADTTLQGNLDIESAARSAGDTATLSSANTYTDTAVSNLIGTAPGVLDTLGEIADAINDDANVYTTLVSQINAVQADVDQNEADGDSADAALSGRLDTLEADPTTAAAVAAVQADVDQNESDSDAAEAALSGRLDVLEADPTTATALAAVQSDVDQNESDSDAADAALSGRLDVLEADPTTATAVAAAVAAVQADVDQNESDADAALALKAPLADPDFTGQLDVDTNARLEFDSNLTKIHNVLRGTSIVIGNNITLNPAAADGRVEIEGEFYLRPSDLTDAANDTAAAAAGVIVGQVYRNGSDLKIRVA